MLSLPQLYSPSILILLAGGVQICGYLLINQTYLRLTMLCSTSLYILYYFNVGDAPLWEAIAISSMTLTTILIGLAALYARNAKWSLPEAHKDIYDLFDTLQPGDFRRVMRSAERKVITSETVVTEEGVPPHDLLYVTKGTFFVTKGNMRFAVPGPTFIGEVAYLRGGPSAATTTLPAGVEVIKWSRQSLAQDTRSSPRLKLALDSLISRDLAMKVSLAVSPDAEAIPEIAKADA
ncbi:MAG: cyclic nucleotide-binding domain-containing protein [Pseudomonadota bacterium]